MGYTGDRKREYQRKWIAKRRKKWIDKNSPCKKCGSFDNLEIDHINHKNKEHHISRLWSRKEEILQEELKKCQVLCKSCHSQKTKIQLMRKITHGTNAGYTKRRCRCELCRNAHALVAREYRANVVE